MKLLILSRIFEVYSTRRLVEEAQGLGHEVQLWTPAAPLPHCTFQPDVVISRFGPFEFAQSMQAIRYFEKKGVPVMNSARAYEQSHDKWTVVQHLHRLGIPTPPSTLWQDGRPPQNVFGEFPAVVKKLDSSQGRGIHLVANEPDLIELKKNYPGEDLLLQKWIKESSGTDYRAFVIGDQVVTGMKRTAKNGEFRSNIHLGGQGQACELTNQEKTWALELAQELDLKMAGIDFLRTKSGSLLLEANPCPGLEGIETCTGINIAKALIKFAEDLQKPL